MSETILPPARRAASFCWIVPPVAGSNKKQYLCALCASVVNQILKLH
jgi:hypothetical protein